MARNPTKEHYEVVLADLHDRKWRLETQRREIDAVIGGLDRSIRGEPRQANFVHRPSAIELTHAINRLPKVNLAAFVKEHYEAETANLRDRRWTLETKLSEINVTISALKRLIPD